MKYLLITLTLITILASCTRVADNNEKRRARTSSISNYDTAHVVFGTVKATTSRVAGKLGIYHIAICKDVKTQYRRNMVVNLEHSLNITQGDTFRIKSKRLDSNYHKLILIEKL